MRVARLDLFGFKSFMERLVLPLEVGVTAVVGPNGCGKSNIVDALRWVLGESRASNLRGGSLEDVIFNGTDKLRPLGLAEVTLTLRPSSQSFLSDLSTPAASIEAVLAGLDAENSKLPSVSEAAAPQLTVIEGRLGKTSDIDQHVEVEISAGAAVAQEDSTSEQPTPDCLENLELDAESLELDERQSLLTRFAWLEGVSEVQVTRRLYRSGESEFFINRVACRLKDIKELFRALGLGARAYTVVAQGEVGRIISAKPEERRLVLEEAAGVSGFREKIAASTRRLEETEQNAARLDDIRAEVSRQVASLKRQAQRALARQELKSELARYERALFVEDAIELRSKQTLVETQRQRAFEQLQLVEHDLRMHEANEEALRGELLAVDIAADQARSQIDALREELLNRARARGDQRTRISALKAHVLAKETELKRLQERRLTLESRRVEVTGELEALNQQQVLVRESLNQVEGPCDEDVRVLGSQLQDSQQILKQAENTLRAAREELVAQQSRLATVREQIVAASPITQLKSNLSEDDFKSIEGLGSELKMFIDGLNVSAEYSTALQAVLAERAAFVVSDEMYKTARAFSRYVAEQPQDRRDGLGLGIMKSGVAPKAVRRFGRLAAEHGLVNLLEVVQVRAEFTLAAERLLGDVFVADSTEKGLTFIEQASFAARMESEVSTPIVVTRAGEIVTDFSFFSLQHAGGVVQLKVRCSELERQCSQLDERVASCTNERDYGQAHVVAAQDRLNVALKEHETRKARIRELSQELAALQARFGAEQRIAGQVSEDLEKLDAQVVETNARINEHQGEVSAIEATLLEQSSDAEVAMQQELEVLASKSAALEAERRGGRERLAESARTTHQLRAKVDTGRQEVGSSELAQERDRLALESLFGRIDYEYGIELRQEIETLLDAAIIDQHERLGEDAKQEYRESAARLRARIQREGDVDPTSVERHDQERARLDELEMQYRDLRDASTTLRKSIEHLRAISEKRFLATFKIVRENFSKLLPRLFGGGRASLELSDPDKPLDSGIEIIARPPGKKLKTIDLMSGGEKALCATGLIFAMFMARPSPLCVLDEVDAPLDEANLQRFLNLVRELSVKTQFILITHNKATMSIADRLIGVTAQQPGASTVVSVSLQDAFNQVA